MRFVVAVGRNRMDMNRNTTQAQTYNWTEKTKVDLLKRKQAKKCNRMPTEMWRMVALKSANSLSAELVETVTKSY